MRDRLIELLDNATKTFRFTAWENTDKIADILLADGWMKPPCKVGDTVYVVTYCRCGNVECYEQGHCHKRNTKRTPKSYFTVMEQQMGYKTFWNEDKAERKYVPKGTICHKVLKKPFTLKMIDDFGKTVFLTKEEAEAALRKEGAEK